jgi:basic amino acid/polyamine antiporter, APA family
VGTPNPGARPSPASPRLGRAIGRSGYFTLAFGAVVGSGWVVILGDWLRVAAPGGTAVGFLAGGLVMVLIGLCYGELAARFSSAGGEFLYTLETFGRRAGFLVAWFLTLYSIAVCAFEAIACAWLLRELIPTINVGTAYTVAGTPVGWDALVIGGVGSLAIGSLHYAGARSAITFQNLVTYGFLLVSVLLIACGLTRGAIRNLAPLWTTQSNESWVIGSLWVFSTCAFFLNGWQTALHAIEERKVNVTTRSAVLSMVIGILAAAAFYIAIVAACASAMPWRSLVGQDLPAVVAFRALGLHGILGTVVLVAATVSLTKTWSAMTWVASRVIFAQARLGFLPSVLARVDPRSGAPRAAIVFVVLLTGAGLALGRGAILPIVDMVAICLALSIILCIAVLLRRRHVDTEIPSFTVPGGTPVIVIALVGAGAMIGVALVQPLIHNTGKVPVEWILLAAWGAIGLLVSAFTTHVRVPATQTSTGKAQDGSPERRI